MATSTTSVPKEPHRSFTVRVPLSTYVRISELAQADAMFLNQKANQLLELGLGGHINLDLALARLLRAKVMEPQQEESSEAA